MYISQFQYDDYIIINFAMPKFNDHRKTEKA